MAKVKKIMLTDVPTLKKEASIEEVAKSLYEYPYGCVVIVENDTPIGIVTELDFVRNMTFQGNKFIKEPVSKIMSSPVISMNPSTKLDEALKLIDTKRFRKYPVVENGKLAGLVTKRDIVNAVSDNLRFHRNIQNFVVVLFILFEFFVFVFFNYLQKYLSFTS